MIHSDVWKLGESKRKGDRNSVQQEAVILPKAWVVYLYSELGMMKLPSILLATNYGAVNANTINTFIQVTA